MPVPSLSPAATALNMGGLPGDQLLQQVDETEEERRRRRLLGQTNYQSLSPAGMALASIGPSLGSRS
jgi:hypothetical protein